eukprot:9610500-Ditylum_brightwellii.AAC.1
MAANEMLVQDNVLNSHSLQHMLHQVMQEDGSYWGALRFLDMVKERNSNMDFNQPGWLYIGPSVKDNENYVQVVLEF